MALTIANNVASLNAQHKLNTSSMSLAKSVERLASGFKINRGADGPAALVISEKQRAQIAGLNAAIANTEKAVSMVQTAEGALNEINSLLVKIRSLAIDSANTGVNDDDALAANQAEITNALETIDRIAANTQFGTKKLLDGTAGLNATSSNAFLVDMNATSSTQQGIYTLSVVQDGQKGQVATATSEAAGAHLSNTTNLAQNETLTINAQAISLTTGMTNTQVVDAINAYQSVTDVEASLDGAGKLVLTAKDFGAGNGFTAVSSLVDTTVGSTGLGTTVLDTEAAPALHVAKRALNLQIDVTAPDASVASFDVASNVIASASGVSAGLSFTVAASASDAAITSNAVHTSTLTVNDGSLTFQIGANAGQTASLSILKASSDALGVNVAGNQFANLKAIDVTSASGSQDSLSVIDSAIDGITNLRGTLGAFQQNTLESTSNNLRATLENTINAESTIRDTDFAAEIANFTKQQVLTQAGTSVLASANQIPQLALSLLG